MLKKILISTAATALLVAGTGSVADATPKHFANCTKLNKVYPHGVGKKHAHDHVTSGRSVTNFKHSNGLYAANKGSDRDHDHVACEKH